MREAFYRQQVPESAVEIMMSSISTSTISQYSSSWKLWWDYCQKNRTDFYNVDVNYLLDFLSKCFLSKNSRLGTINCHRSAIAFISTNKLLDERIKKFFRGIFRIRPTFPKYSTTWNPSTVLNYLRTLENDLINLELLTKKLVLLLALASGQRVQTLSLIKICNIKMSDSKVLITITDIIKTSRVGRPQPVIELPFYSPDLKICPVNTLKSYLDATKNNRNVEKEKLLLTYKKPYKGARCQTISRWIKDTLSRSGINTEVFSAHSTRHASTSAAARHGLSVNVIFKSAGWSGQSQTFANYYNRPIDTNDSTLVPSVFLDDNSD